MKYIFYTIFIVTLILINAYSQKLPNILKEANLKVELIKADRFVNLPDSIKDFINENNYTIPQTYIDKNIHNVIYGEFIRKNQKDWAVLVLKNFVSKIIIFSNCKIDSNNIIELSPADDIVYLQGIGENKIGFSRYISPVDSNYI